MGRFIPIHSIRQFYNKITEKQADAIYIDIGGLGCGVYDRLREMGAENLYPVNFGEKADEPLKYLNKRSEMYARAKEWLANKPVHIEDSTEFVNQLLMIEIEPNTTRLQLIPKTKMLYSPDIADAFAMTFYEKDS